MRPVIEKIDLKEAPVFVVEGDEGRFDAFGQVVDRYDAGALEPVEWFDEL